MRDPYTIIVRPHITEKSVALSSGDFRIKDMEELTRKYTFVVAPDANKIEIKAAIEAIYNQDKKANDDSRITVTNVRTINVVGKMRRVGNRKEGRKTGFKKAIVTLAKGQMLEDYGV